MIQLAGIFSKYRKKWEPFLCAILSGLFFAFSFAPYDFYLLAWFSFVPLLYICTTRSLTVTYYTTLGSITLAFIVGMPWLSTMAQKYLFWQSPSHYLFTVGYGIFIAHAYIIVFFLFSWSRKNTPYLDYITYPTFVTVIIEIFPSLFPFQLGDSQSHFLVAIQPIEFFGVSGLTWLIGFTHIGIFHILCSEQKKNRRIAFIVLSSVLSLWFICGIYLYNQWNGATDTWETVKIGIVQPNREALLSSQPHKKGYSYEYPEEMELTKKAVVQGAKIVFWPEGRYLATERTDVKQSFLLHGEKLGIDLFFQDLIFDKKESKRSNSFLWFTPQGTVAGKYDKTILVPFGEYLPLYKYFGWLYEASGWNFRGLKTGKYYQTFTTNTLSIFPLLCYESIFSEYVASGFSQSKQGKIIVTLSQNGWYDSFQQVSQHSNSSKLRAVENRAVLLHVVQNGFSSVTLPDGSVFYTTPYKERGVWVVDLPYNTQYYPTLYNSFPSFIRTTLQLFFIVYIIWFMVLYLIRRKHEKETI